MLSKSAALMVPVQIFFSFSLPSFLPAALPSSLVITG